MSGTGGEDDAPDAGTAPEGHGGPAPAAQGGVPPGGGPRARPGDAVGVASFDRRMLEALVCPLTQDRLDWDAERSELVSRKAGLAYPVRDGIPIMLESEARPLDP